MRGDPVFPGVSRPSSDFPAVRSELRAPPMYRDIDLSVARSLLAGTALRLTIAGNMIYIDQKGNSGYAVLHVQDDASVGNTPITVFPGFLARLPFTELILENVAQTGQVLRIIYGTDMDFQPIPGGGVSVLNALNINDQVDSVCQVIRVEGSFAVGSNQVTVVLAAATNPRGFVLRHAHMLLQSNVAGLLGQSIIAALTAPVLTIGSQTNAHVISYSDSTAGVIQVVDTGFCQRRFPAGWGVWVINTVTVGAAVQTLARVSLEIL